MHSIRARYRPSREFFFLVESDKMLSLVNEKLFGLLIRPKIEANRWRSLFGCSSIIHSLIARGTMERIVSGCLSAALAGGWSGVLGFSLGNKFCVSRMEAQRVSSRFWAKPWMFAPSHLTQENAGSDNSREIILMYCSSSFVLASSAVQSTRIHSCLL